MKCGTNTIKLVTSCVGPRETAFCSKQIISFYDDKMHNVKDIYYHHKKDQHDQSFIAEATCFKLRQQFLISLFNTNFSNCDSCEWIDLFDLNGSYIGSTKGISNDNNIVVKKIPQDIEDAILSNKGNYTAEEQSTLEISRVR